MNQTLGDMRKKTLTNYHNATKNLSSQSNYLSSIGKQLKNSNVLEIAKTARQLKCNNTLEWASYHNATKGLLSTSDFLFSIEKQLKNSNALEIAKIVKQLKYNNTLEWIKINQKQFEHTFDVTNNMKINEFKNLSQSSYLNNKTISNINRVLNNVQFNISFKPVGLYDLYNINRNFYNIKTFGQFKKIANIVINYNIDLNKFSQFFLSNATHKYILKNSIYNSTDFNKAMKVIKNIAHQTFDESEDLQLSDEDEKQSLILYFLFRINENIKIISSITRDVGAQYTAYDFLEDDRLYLPSFIFLLLSILTNALTNAIEDKYEPHTNKNETKSKK